jgi:hypothetical protein
MIEFKEVRDLERYVFPLSGVQGHPEQGSWDQCHWELPLYCRIGGFKVFIAIMGGMHTMFICPMRVRLSSWQLMDTALMGALRLQRINPSSCKIVLGVLLAHCHTASWRGYMFPHCVKNVRHMVCCTVVVPCQSFVDGLLDLADDLSQMPGPDVLCLTSGCLVVSCCTYLTSPCSVSLGYFCPDA